MGDACDHPRLRMLEPLANALEAAADATVRNGKRAYRQFKRKGDNRALRPGPQTPLWNELVQACIPFLIRRGEKAKLARVLGVSRQRLHLMLVRKSACPDGERALQLLAWLRARKRGIAPA